MATAALDITYEDENLESYCLIWLDASVNESQENIQAQKHFRTSVNHLIAFEDDEQCLRYIESVPKDDRIILIVSGRLGQIIVPKIVKYRHIVSIYVYCMNKKANEQWAKQFNKVKAVIVELNELIHRINTDQHQRKHNKIDESLPLCIINSKDVDNGQSTTELSGQFLHSELLLDCLIKMKPNKNEREELIALCKQKYDGNSVELVLVEKFEQDYSAERALWWYTRDSFVYQMLNKALRVQNIHLLFLFRFVIRDIEQQLEKNKCTTPIRVYRAQMMSTDEVQMLKDSLGEFIAINTFISTSLDDEKARSFFKDVDHSNDGERVFFDIEADPQLTGIKSFSDISSYSYYPEEKEVLFMIGSIFRLVNIDRDKDGILIVRMKLFSNNDHHLKSLFQHMQKKPRSGETNLLDFGDVLIGMGKWDAAEKYYHRFLDQKSGNQRQISSCYHSLGTVAKKKGDYESSLNWYNESLEIKMRILKADDPSIAKTYLSIGQVYHRKKDDERAWKSYEKALAIHKRAFGEDSVGVASCMIEMGDIYKRKQKYVQALEIDQKALFIQEKHFPTNDRQLSTSHQNIGVIYRYLGQYDLALSHCNLALRIYKKTLPSQHPDIAKTLGSIGLIYEDKGDFQQALSYYEGAAAIYRQSLSSTHPDVKNNEQRIRRVSSKLK